MERRNYEKELREIQGQNTECSLAEVEENLKEQQQDRRKFELEAELYAKWRQGVENDNLTFESKSNDEVSAKMNLSDRQVHQQLQQEKDEEAAEERQNARENEFHKIRRMQEYHLEQIEERQKEIAESKVEENKLEENLNDIKRESELLEENYAVLTKAVDLNDPHNFNNIKILMHKRSEKFRNHIGMCLSILDRTLNFAEKPENLTQFRRRLEQQLEEETQKLAQIEHMYESEAKRCFQRMEQLWQEDLVKRNNELKKILMDEYHLINTKLNELIKTHEELLKIRSTHMSVVENCSEKLKQLMQEEENAPSYLKYEEAKQEPTPPDHVHNIIQNQFDESDDTPLYSPRLGKRSKTGFVAAKETADRLDYKVSPDGTGPNRISNTFNHLNLEDWPTKDSHFSSRELESQKMDSQRLMQVVTSETEAERPRFGRKHNLN